jgi:molecular chaperone HscC
MANIGIDLGTTNSLIAVFEHGKSRLIRNALGQELTPSAVSILESGEVIVGQAAKERLLTHPSQSAASFKRFMGTNKKFQLGSQTFTPVELSALVLKNLRLDAERELKEQIETVVLSVPAYFNEQQRRATIEASRLAGLEVSRLVNEPTAAALAYGLTEKQEGCFLIFDLGGGTFDVSVLDKFSGVMEVRATTGDTRLGGDDFTYVLAAEIALKIGVEIDKLTRQERASLFSQAEKSKLSLSSAHSTTFRMPVNGRHQEVTVTRAEFEAAASKLLAKLRTPTERAVRDGGTASDDFGAVVLVGGATRLPMIRSLVAKMFGRLPLTHIDPDTTVALGAAVQAGLVGRDCALNEIVMTDVCPFTLGIAVVDSEESILLHINPVIDRNATIPISRQITLTTVRDNQSFLTVAIYQGESFRPENSVLIGEIEAKIPRGPKGKESIEARLTYDINGNLQVEVLVQSTAVRYERIFAAGSGTSEAELAESFNKLASIKLFPHERAENQALIARAERVFEECSGDFRDEVGRLLLLFLHEINDQQLRHPELIRQNLSKQLDFIESQFNVLQ